MSESTSEIVREMRSFKMRLEQIQKIRNRKKGEEKTGRKSITKQYIK